MPYVSTPPFAAAMDDVSRGIATEYGTAIALERGSTVLATQKFVVDFYVSASDAAGILGQTAEGGESGQTVIGLYGPPEANVERGDQFAIGHVHYRVVMAHPNADGAQRVAYAVGRQP